MKAKQSIFFVVLSFLMWNFRIADAQQRNTFTVDGVSFDMIYIEAGSFMMGMRDDEIQDVVDGTLQAYPQLESRAEEIVQMVSQSHQIHKVSLNEFYIGETEVTQGLWKAVMGYNPSINEDGDYGFGDNFPVCHVSWYDCQEFIDKLNEKTGMNFRLPTEAEWEYAARGGNRSRGYKYSGSNNLSDVAWFYDNSDSKPHPVKSKKPNELGIYDMTGNIEEWCQDVLDKDYYSNSPSFNPKGSKNQWGDRVLRGGSWHDLKWDCYVSNRGSEKDYPKYFNYGLRLALNVGVPQSIKDYAASIKDDGRSLEKEEFSLGYGTIKGRIYGYDSEDDDTRYFANIKNPFTMDYNSYEFIIAEDGTFEVKLPMVVKFQLAKIDNWHTINTEVLLSQGKTVEVFFEKTRLGSVLKPYFVGENADINYAINIENNKFYPKLTQDNYSKIVELSPDEFKQFVFDFFDKECAVLDTMKFTTRAKEMITLFYKRDVFSCLTSSAEIMEKAYRRTNHIGYTDSIPNYVAPVFEYDYWDYPKQLGFTDIMMFYNDYCADEIYSWQNSRIWKSGRKYGTFEELAALFEQRWQILQQTEHFSENEKNIIQSIVNKYKTRDYNYSDEEKAFWEKYVDKFGQTPARFQAEWQALFEKVFGNGDSYASDLLKLHEYCNIANPYRDSDEQWMMPDSLMEKIKKMRFSIYYDYFKRRNDAITAQKNLFEKRGGYHVHEIMGHNSDSIVEKIIEPFKGKVVLIDMEYIWYQRGKNHFKIVEFYNSLKDKFFGKEIVFVYVATPNVSSDTWEEQSPKIPGHHFYVDDDAHKSLKSMYELGRHGHPPIILVGKDGVIKDIQTEFKGYEYYIKKIEEELKK